MSRKWIGVAVAIVAVGGTALATADGRRRRLGRPARLRDRDRRPGPGRQRRREAERAGVGGKKKPKVVYLQSSAPVPINPADPAAGGVGPYVDVTLTGCSKVIDGGVVPSRLDVYSQGTYVAEPERVPRADRDRRGQASATGHRSRSPRT